MNIRLNQMKFDVPSYEKTPALKFRISKMQKLGGDYSYFHRALHFVNVKESTTVFHSKYLL